MRPNPDRDAEIRERVASGMTHAAVAAMFNIHPSRVSQIATGLAPVVYPNAERDAEIRRLISSGRRHADVAAMFGLRPCRVSQIVNSAAKVVAKGAKMRRCLACRDDFPSGWAGERICPTCKRNPEWQAAEAVHVA